jgi:diadenosine tetraphosphate (Ap4A) HIT family hydrolase
MSACPFCDFDRARLVLESESAIALRDGFPVADGHTLVIPRRHVPSIFQLSAPDQAALWVLVADVRELLIKDDFADAINIGVNDGWAAGQTIEHAHIHLIPRRRGDVADPRGGIRNIIPSKARYWEE